MSLTETIQQEISNIVPKMIEDSITIHSHNGSDSTQIMGNVLVNAPQNSLTATSGLTLSAGGTAVISTNDNTIITNAIQRIADLETSLKALGLIS